MKKDYINPPALLPPHGYTHVLSVAGASRIIFISGQVAVDKEGKLIGAGDLKAQMRQAAQNLKTALAAAGAAPSDVVKMNTYIVNYKPADWRALREVLAELFPEGTRFPASTMVGVTALAVDGLMVEMEATATLA